MGGKGNSRRRREGSAKVTPLTDAQLRAYFAYLYGPDEPAPAIVDASDDALEPLPVPPNPNELETWQDVIQSPTPESD
jgi:hypothetical protein